jgi:hypothetical protein
MLLPIPDQITSFFKNHNESVVKNLMIVTQGVFCARSTNLNLVKDELGNLLHNQEQTKPESNYKRLTRFFNLGDEEKAKLATALLSLSFFLLNGRIRKPKHLIVDGTSWELGDRPIHLITLAVVIEGVSIPICWEELSKKGTSNYKERKKLLDRACENFDLSGMILLADREYIGKKWFNYLVDKGLGFVIRLKKDIYRSYVDEQSGQKHPKFKHQQWRYSALERLAGTKLHIRSGVSKQIEMEGKCFTFAVLKNPKKNAKEPLIYFISTLNKCKQITTSYPIRWKIECCFKHLKSNGFNLESLNLKNKQKIKLMMAIVCFIYTLCINQGIIVSREVKKSDLKKYKSGIQTLAVSIFKRGKAILSGKFCDLNSFCQFITTIMKGKKTLNWVNVQ